MLKIGRLAYSAVLALARMGQPQETTKAEGPPPTGEPERGTGADGKTELRLYGDVMDQESIASLAGMGWPIQAVSATGFARALEEYKPDRLRINSPGGVVSEGIAIANMVREHGIPVVVDGGAYSIASLIAAASPHVTMLPGTLMMIHAPHTAVYGNAYQMRLEADALDKFAESMLEIYEGKAGKGKGVEKYLDGRQDYYLTGAEAVAAGLADVAESGAQSAVAAQARIWAHAHGYQDPGTGPQSPCQNPVPPAPVVDQGKKCPPSVRVSHRPGAFYGRRP